MLLEPILVTLRRTFSDDYCLRFRMTEFRTLPPLQAPAWTLPSFEATNASFDRTVTNPAAFLQILSRYPKITDILSLAS